MIGAIPITLVFIATAAFVDYRLWWSVRHQTIQVKGRTFKREQQPTQFWVYLTSNTIAALLLTALAVTFVVLALR